MRDVTDLAQADDRAWVSGMQTGAITRLRQRNDRSIPLRTGRWSRSPRWRSPSWEHTMRTLKSPTQFSIHLDVPIHAVLV